MTETQSPPSPPTANGSEAHDQPAPASAGTSPAAENQNLKIKNPSPPRQRSGHVARLPKALRAQINQLLDDGFSYRAVREQLGDIGKHLTNDNIRRWKKGGYQDHLRQLRLSDESRGRFELTLDLAREEPGIDVYQAAHKIAAGLIAEAVAEIGADSLREAIKANPLNLLRMLKSLSRLTAGAIKCERHLVDQADRQSPLQQDQAPKPKKGVSKSSIQQMEDALHLM